MNVRQPRPTEVDDQAAEEQDSSAGEQVDEQPSGHEEPDDPEANDVQADAGNLPVAEPVDLSAEVPLVPPKHTPLWKDMLRVSLVFAACWLMVQVILSPILLGLVVLFDPQVQAYVIDLLDSGGSLATVTTDPAGQRLAAYSLWITAFSVLAGVALFLIVRKRKLFTTDLTTTKPVDNRWLELGAALAFIIGIQMLLSLVDALIALTGYDPSSVQSNLLGGGLGTVSGVLVVMVIEPFLEEWIFRGAILRQLAPYGVNFAIVTQAVLFALWHGNLYQGIYAFFLGLILGYVAYNFSLKWSYALHAIANGLSVLFSASWMPEWLPWVILGLGLIASVVIIVYFRKVVPLLVSEGAPTIEHPFKQGWKNPAFIIVTALLFLFCCWAMTALGG